MHIYVQRKLFRVTPVSSSSGFGVASTSSSYSRFSGQPYRGGKGYELTPSLLLPFATERNQPPPQTITADHYVLHSLSGPLLLLLFAFSRRRRRLLLQIVVFTAAVTEATTGIAAATWDSSSRCMTSRVGHLGGRRFRPSEREEEGSLMMQVEGGRRREGEEPECRRSYSGVCALLC